MGGVSLSLPFFNHSTMERLNTSEPDFHESRMHASTLIKSKIKVVVEFCDKMSILYFKKTFFVHLTSVMQPNEELSAINLEDITMSLLRLKNVIVIQL
jgi:hypothetical protein